MNICCFVRLTLAHEPKGGMEVHVKTMSEGLVRKGHRVCIITTAHPMGIDYETIEGVNIYYCRRTLPGQYSNAWGEASLRLFAELHKMDPFDLIWGEGGGAYYYLQAKGKSLHLPVVTYLQGTFLGDMRSQLTELRVNKKLILLFAKRFPKRFYEYLKRDMVFVRRADAVIGPSRECARDACLEYFVPKDRISESVNGIDVKMFRPVSRQPDKAEYSLGIDTSSLRIFTASRLTREKGIHILIRSFPRILDAVPNATLWIAGVGPSKSQLVQLAEDLKVDRHVKFIGYIQNENLVTYLNACDVFVYPTFRYEAFGISVAEAMACGKMVVASNRGGVATSVDNGINGFLYEPSKPGQLARICIRALKDPSLRIQMGQAARRKAVESLSSERMLKDVMNVFEHVLDRSGMH